MILNRIDFSKKLKFVSQAINLNALLPEYKNVHFSGERIYASDGSVTIATEGIEELDMCLAPEIFLGILEQIDTEEINVSITKKNLEFKTDKLEGKFKIGLPEPLEICSTKNAIKSEGFEKLFYALHLCKNGTCKDKAAEAAKGVRVENGFVWSTDRYRAFQFELDSPPEIPNVTLPVKFIEIVEKVVDEIDSFGADENIFYVGLKDGTHIQTRIIDGEFPPVQKHFNQIDKSEFIDIPFEENIRTIIERHSGSFLRGIEFSDREISLQFEDTKCRFFSKHEFFGELEEVVDLSFNIGNFKFVINPNLIVDILQYSDNKMKYDINSELILIEAENLQILIQTKE